MSEGEPPGGQIGGSNRTRAAKPASSGPWNSAGRVASEWNTPTFGFAPKCASIAAEMSPLSLKMSVGMLWVHRLLTAFYPWLRRSWTTMSNRSASSDQKR